MIVAFWGDVEEKGRVAAGAKAVRNESWAVMERGFARAGIRTDGSRNCRNNGIAMVGRLKRYHPDSLSQLRLRSFNCQMELDAIFSCDYVSVPRD